VVQADFMAKGMMDKLEKLHELLVIMDPDVVAHFKAIDADDMVFCHRWLLLSFKREFAFGDAIRLFEILCSHHLELTGPCAPRLVQPAGDLAHQPMPSTTNRCPRRTWCPQLAAP
jgi:hypothetical protein